MSRTATAPRSRSKAKSKRNDVMRAVCGSPTKSGRGPCRRRPGEGTDHEGIGPCSLHTGSTTNQIKHAAVIAAGGTSLIKDGPVMGTPIQMEPVDALLWCVSITAGEVAYLTAKVQELTDGQLFGRPVTRDRERGTTGAVNMHGEEGYRDLTKTAWGAKELNLVIRERQRAVDRLARFSKMALDAGVAERAVSLAERQGDLIVHILGGIIEDVGLTAKQMEKLEASLPARLAAMESPTIMIGG